jgi:hypothetical protein
MRTRVSLLGSTSPCNARMGSRCCQARPLLHRRSPVVPNNNRDITRRSRKHDRRQGSVGRRATVTDDAVDEDDTDIDSVELHHGSLTESLGPPQAQTLTVQYGDREVVFQLFPVRIVNCYFAVASCRNFSRARKLTLRPANIEDEDGITRLLRPASGRASRCCCPASFQLPWNFSSASDSV